jgi:hypothetical protein
MMMMMGHDRIGTGILPMVVAMDRLSVSPWWLQMQKTKNDQQGNGP